jgi:hypothetical protein
VVKVLLLLMMLLKISIIMVICLLGSCVVGCTEIMHNIGRRWQTYTMLKLFSVGKCVLHGCHSWKHGKFLCMVHQQLCLIHAGTGIDTILWWKSYEPWMCFTYFFSSIIKSHIHRELVIRDLDHGDLPYCIVQHSIPWCQYCSAQLIGVSL